MKKQYKKYFIVNISAIIAIVFMLFFSGCEKRGKNAKENSVPTSNALTMAAGAQPFAIISVHAIHHYHHKCMKEDKHNRLSQSKLKPIQTEGIEK